MQSMTHNLTTTESFQHSLAYQPVVDVAQIDSWYGIYHPWHLKDSAWKPKMEILWRLVEQYASTFRVPCGIAWIAEHSFGVYFPNTTPEAIKDYINNHPAVSRRSALGDGWVVEIQPLFLSSEV